MSSYPPGIPTYNPDRWVPLSGTGGRLPTGERRALGIIRLIRREIPTCAEVDLPLPHPRVPPIQQHRTGRDGMPTPGENMNRGRMTRLQRLGCWLGWFHHWECTHETYRDYGVDVRCRDCGRRETWGARSGSTQ